MSGVDLSKEMAAAVNSMGTRHVDELTAAGVDRLEIALGLIGVACGRVEGDLFEPDDDDGRPAYVTPVRVDPFHPLGIETPHPADALRVGDIIDLVYWHPLYPREWAVRTGATEVLGLIPPQLCGPEPVEIYRGPLRWFQSGCVGLVPLSRKRADLYRILSQCSGGLVAEDERHKRELDAILAHPYAHPTVTVRRAAEAHRAA